MTLEELLADFTRGAGMAGNAVSQAIPSMDQLRSAVPAEQDIYNYIFDQKIKPMAEAYNSAELYGPALLDSLSKMGQAMTSPVSAVLSRVNSGLQKAASRYADPQMSPPLMASPVAASGGGGGSGDLESMLADFNQKLNSMKIQKGSHTSNDGREVLDFTVKDEAKYQPSRGSFSKVKMTYAGDRDAQAQMQAKMLLTELMNSGKKATAQSDIIAAALKAVTAGAGDPKQNLASILTLLQAIGAGQK